MLLLIGLVLFAAVSITFVFKDARFGTTPFYSAVGLMWQESTGYLAYVIEHGIRSLFSSRAAAQLSSDAAAGIPVITYHRLVDRPDGVNVTVAAFKEQMEALKEDGWQTITLDDFATFMKGDRSLSAKSILITFDDGAKQSFYPADPVLQVLGFNAVNYIVVEASRLPESTYYLSEAEIKRMLESGRWEIGSHSFDGHRPYAVDAAGDLGNFFADRIWRAEEGRLESDAEFAARVRDDFEKSRSALEEAYGVPVDTFAFPFGETGLYLAGNFPGGSRIADQEAARVYSYAWLQESANDYSYNYPDPESFLVRRIKALPEWSGEDIVAALSAGLGKSLPYSDDLSADRGWKRTWGDVAVENDALTLRASEESAGASAFLDGTRHWNDYQYEASINLERGYAILMADVVDASTYRTCSFTDGSVRLQDVRGSTRSLLGERDLPDLSFGDLRLGMRSEGNTVSCIWNGRTVLTASGLSERKGGIGVQTWDERTGAAALSVQDLSVSAASQVKRPPVLPTSVAAEELQDPLIPNTGSSPQPQNQNNSSTPYSAFTIGPAPAPQEPNDPTPPKATTTRRSFLDDFLSRFRQQATTTDDHDNERRRGRR